MNKGFYLKSLQVIGPNLPTAQIQFDAGLNVVSGASNTGKSYIFQCINFVLGGGKQPKDINEAKGYSEIRLQINTWDKKEYTFARELTGGKIRVVEGNITNFSEKPSTELNSIASEENDNNISTFLLDLIGLKDQKLKKDTYNAKKNLSFRDLVKFCMIDENQIISEDPPIYSGQNTDKTAEESLFKLILSGTDDSILEEKENPKNVKQRLTGGLEFIDKSIIEKQIKIQVLEKIATQYKEDQINQKIDEFTQLINESFKEINQEETKRTQIWNIIEKLRSEIDQLKELDKRFGLLNAHYESDLKRLDFINEGKQYLDQLKTVPCPICFNTIDKTILDNYSEENSPNLITSITSEAKKTQQKQSELSQTIKNISNQKTELQKQLDQEKEKYKEIDTAIKNKLNPLVQIHRQSLKQFLEIKDAQTNLTLLKNELNELKQKKSEYEISIKEVNKRNKKGERRQIAENYYELFSQQLSGLLKKWGLKYESIFYSKDSNDIVLDNRKRAEFGKGLRAIIRAAFMVSLIKYCQTNNKPHPSFLILDSPLTTYKGQDIIREANDELLEDIETLFFESLVEYTKIKDIQILILDNKEPPTNMRSQINYIHFSGNYAKLPQGFYPKQSS